MSKVLEGRRFGTDKLIQYNGISKLKYFNGQNYHNKQWNGNQDFPPPPEGCVLYLPGLPGQGSIIKDYSGEGNDGTIYGATWARNDQGVWGLNFDGNDDRITVNDVASLDHSTGITILIWANLTDNTRSEMLLCKNPVNKDYQLYHENTALYYRAASKIQFGTVPSQGAWHLWGVSHNISTTNANVYIDGSNNDQERAVGTPGTDAGDLDIGRYGGGAPAYYLKGKLALVRLIDGVLTAAEHNSVFQLERHLFGV